MEGQDTPKSNLPVYNIKAVARLVGLLPVTLRAWERRYGLPVPQRGIQGYRLYSEHDLRTLRWLKSQIDSGFSISRAIDYLQELRSHGSDPTLIPINIPLAVEPAPASISLLFKELHNQLVTFRETEAKEILRRAFALYTIDQVLTEIIQPTMVDIGESWHRGEIPIAVEHYATQFCMQQLMSMLSASAPTTRPGSIIAACAPGEMHQIGVLMLIVMLRWRGWDVKYLGPNLSLDRLEEALSPLHPRMLLFTATRRESAQELLALPEILKKFPEPQPLIVFGGKAFTDTHLPDNVPAIYLNALPTEMVSTIEELLQNIH
jgi:MerR family transcriptional regulator, light-induced transcriptional regulator